MLQCSIMETQATTYSLSGPTTRKAQTRIGPLTVVAQLNRTTGEPYGVRFYDACGMLHYVTDKTKALADAWAATIDRRVGRWEVDA